MLGDHAGGRQQRHLGLANPRNQNCPKNLSKIKTLRTSRQMNQSNLQRSHNGASVFFSHVWDDFSSDLSSHRPIFRRRFQHDSSQYARHAVTRPSNRQSIRYHIPIPQPQCSVTARSYQGSSQFPIITEGAHSPPSIRSLPPSTRFRIHQHANLLLQQHFSLLRSTGSPAAPPHLQLVKAIDANKGGGLSWKGGGC